MDDITTLRTLVLAQMSPEFITKTMFARVPGPVTCYGCNKQFSGMKAVNIIVPVEFTVGSTPYDAVPPFQCPQEEHWACSPECYAIAAKKCIDEHMVPLLRVMYDRIEKEQRNAE